MTLFGKTIKNEQKTQRPEEMEWNVLTSYGCGIGVYSVSVLETSSPELVSVD